MQLSLTVAINCLGKRLSCRAKQSFPIVKSKNDYYTDTEKDWAELERRRQWYHLVHRMHTLFLEIIAISTKVGHLFILYCWITRCTVPSPIRSWIFVIPPRLVLVALVSFFLHFRGKYFSLCAQISMGIVSSKLRFWGKFLWYLVVQSTTKDLVGG